MVTAFESRREKSKSKSLIGIEIESDVIRIEALHFDFDPDFDNNYSISHQQLLGDRQRRFS